MQIATALPANMGLVNLPIEGLAPQAANALVTWHPEVSFDAPLLVVLFFHGLEDDPQTFAWNGHRLPAQVAGTPKNVILVAPTMRLDGNSVDPAYLDSGDRIAMLLTDGVAAAAAAIRRPAPGTLTTGGLLLAGYSNGHLAWRRAVTTLRAAPDTAPPLVGHALFDCLYWSTPLMKGAEAAGVDDARLSDEARGICRSGFVTTHFSKGGQTLLQARSFDAMVRREAALTLYDDVPSSLAAGDVVITVLPTRDHFEAVSCRSELARVMAAVPGFDLPRHGRASEITTSP